MTNYNEKAKAFCKATNTKITINFATTKQNPWNAKDYQSRWIHNIYRVTISRNGQRFTFKFTDSYNNYLNNEQPTEYDILACLQKYDIGSFEDFCAEFGYEMYPDYTERGNKYGYNTKNYNTYKAVKKEYENVINLFSDCSEELAEIC